MNRLCRACFLCLCLVLHYYGISSLELPTNITSPRLRLRCCRVSLARCAWFRRLTSRAIGTLFSRGFRSAWPRPGRSGLLIRSGEHLIGRLHRSLEAVNRGSCGRRCGGFCLGTADGFCLGTAGGFAPDGTTAVNTLGPLTRSPRVTLCPREFQRRRP